jgi:hypothetical protein
MMKPELLRNTESNETPNRDVIYRGSRARGHAHLGKGDSCGVGMIGVGGRIVGVILGVVHRSDPVVGQLVINRGYNV